MPTMKEVASRAGVSLKSVSRVVNGHPNTSAEVREKVERAIAELGWRPNTHARSLRTGRTGLIALSVPDLRTSSASHLAQALVSEAERQGLRVAIEPSHGRAERVRRTLDACGASFDAVVHVGALPAGIDPASLDPAHPVVLVRAAESLEQAWADAPPEAAADGPARDAADEPAGNAAGATGGSRTPRDGAAAASLDSVDTDSDASARAVHHHLRTVGRSRVVILGREAGAADGFTRALSRAFADAPVLRPSHTADRAAGRELAAQALAAAPASDALVCAEDELAIGALSLLHERGIAVPGRIAVTGHGNIDDGQFTTPTLTTIDLGLPSLARHVVEQVRARLDGDRSPARRIVLRARILRRESTLGLGGIGPTGAVGGAAGIDPDLGPGSGSGPSPAPDPAAAADRGPEEAPWLG
ncbi:LacI family transcriptional regulator [Brachybacterium phenoliresistens]|uniref:LacI family transcriptional regulator n=2 Tax=Brachybacterium phenoliresistens TaxID=396014 RepID=Z9JN03_9MICO|nr:LacI family transcriptional regulator [Brachybacterium phenoliresistens]